ncbi:6-phosphogluconate dehydrogenase, decarboxylating [Candidatus Ecksteinia adelgidicola]|nr:6-phosphogluconate dehydrogenase, decarboxylating [Candidatus Ecksteinia adelgidicola]
MSKQHIGVFGMAVMGYNLALNIESHGYSVSVFNRSKNKTTEIIQKNIDKNLIACFTVEEFVYSLIKPRNILLMIQAGEATDKAILSLIPYLEEGDILIDGGNSHYKDTIRRNKSLSKKGLNFIGVGISGGEKGALRGPSIMAGGQKKAYQSVKDIFKKIAAIVENKPCVTYVGENGAGHYVKMVHNGIEYGNMQLISEIYILLKKSLKLSNKKLSEIFTEWNKGELNSYLINITKDIFIKKDEKDHYIIDMILDKAENKNTGKWTSQSALSLGEPLSLITESVFSRYISSIKEERMIASKVLNGPKITMFNGNKIEFIEKIRRALYFGKIISYVQGFSQLKSASKKNKWNLNYSKIANIFRAGCIIQAKLLQKISEVYINNPDISNLLLAPYFQEIINKYQDSLRYVVTYSLHNGIPIPALSSAITYYDSYRSARLPANLIQAQRDYFGAHTYKRIDKKGIFHTEWIK